MTDLDEADRIILNRIQSNFPITQRPFEQVGKEVGLEEQEVIRRVDRLKKAGIIRRIGGNFFPEKLGYVSTLCAAKVPEDKIGAFAETVNRYAGVTHNYVRDGAYNVWFTFIAASRDEIAQSLEAISRKTGIHSIINLPARAVYKIRAKFRV